MESPNEREKWYNIHFRHERRNAHVAAARRRDEVFGCIPHGRGAYRLVASG